MAACHASLVDSHQNCSKPMEGTPTGSHLAVVGRALFIIKGNGITQDILGYDLSDFSAGRLSRSQHFPVFLRCRARLATAAAHTVGTAKRSAVSIQPSAQQAEFFNPRRWVSLLSQRQSVAGVPPVKELACGFNRSICVQLTFRSVDLS
jgi:hypothetical protein